MQNRRGMKDRKKVRRDPRLPSLSPPILNCSSARFSDALQSLNLRWEGVSEISRADCLLTLLLTPILQIGKPSLGILGNHSGFSGSGIPSLGPPVRAPCKAGTEPLGVRLSSSRSQVQGFPFHGLVIASTEVLPASGSLSRHAQWHGVPVPPVASGHLSPHPAMASGPWQLGLSFPFTCVLYLHPGSLPATGQEPDTL